MNINWENLQKPDLYDVSLYQQIFDVPNSIERNLLRDKLFELAKKFKITGSIKENYFNFEKEQKNIKQANSIIFFGENAPIKSMIAPGYYKDNLNYIRTFDKNILVTATLLQPVAILKNKESNEELVKCAFLRRGHWAFFVINKETILNNGKITKLANKGVDVTSDSSRLLVNYIRDLLNNNDIPELVSTSKMGWNKDDSFLPYDEDIEFDGEDNFKISFESLHSKGDYNKWLEQISSDRIDNVPLKLVMATSFASPLLHVLHRQSFVTLLWGKTGGGKTVSGRIAMSIWGDSEKGKLMFSMNNTSNFYYRTAEFFNHLPVFFDELQTYSGSINKLIMSITEGIDRGKANIDVGTQKPRYWNNSFIFTGEESASDINSGGGTLNRLIEIYIQKDVIKDGIKTCDVINENYGFAGKIFIDYVKKLGKEKINEIFKDKYNKLMLFDFTEEKQAINMAMLLTADDLACQCIFKNEKPLEEKDVFKYMFSKKEIDNAQRAYDMFLDECEINKSKFKDFQKGYEVNSINSNSEFWGIKDEYEITIVTKKLRDILTKNGFNYNKIIKDWHEKGYIEKFSNGRYTMLLSKNGIRAYYTIVKIKIDE